MTKPALGIIGPGTVGTALAKLAVGAGYDEVAIGGRSAQHALAAARAAGKGVVAASALEVAGRSQWLILAVRDGEIEGVARELAAAGGVKPNTLVAHCSGAVASSVLDSLRAIEGVTLASFHPLQTFPDIERAIATLPGSHCFAEGDETALAALQSFAADLGLHFVEIETSAKPLYHASAVLACNYFTTLMDTALASFEAAGVERATAWQALSPLVHATLDNNDALGAENALTGPIRRGDGATVAMHLEALAAASPDLVPVYRALGVRTVDLARRTNSLDEKAAKALLALLTREAAGD